MKHILPIALAVSLTACGYGWKEDAPAYPPARAPSSVAGAGAAGSPASGDYVVQPGDTLYAIGFKNQIDYLDLAQWNGIGGDYLIRSGQVLRLTPPPGTDGVLVKPLPGSTEIIAAPKPVADSSLPVPVPVAPSLPGPVTQPPPPLATVPVLSVPPVPRPMPLGNSALRWQWPTTGNVIKSYNMAAGSKGIDIGGELGQPVHAVAGGKVVYSGSALKGYGELIIVKHDESYLSAYGHNRRRLAKEGDEVRAGQTIAELGVGPEQKPILHFEIRENGKPVDPLRFLPAN
ncbi:MAG: peptidoglycan DD-metalloendopeptidase family protein [Pseudomonadota bacterium]